MGWLMTPVDHDLKGKPIYSPIDLAIRAATLPVFYSGNRDRCWWCSRELVDGKPCCDPIEMANL
jgi:hypothetical protein